MRAKAQAPATSRLRKRPYHRWYATQRWRKMAKYQVEVVEPLCRICKADGRVTEATIADHVEPHRGDEHAFWFGELQSLCATCHLRKLNHEQFERRTGKPYKRRRGCGPDGMPLDPDHHWSRS